MVSLFLNNTRPIGLDIGHNSIKMIQLSSASDNLKVIAAEEVHYENNPDNPDATRQAIIESIRGVVAKGHFKGKEVVSCLPNDIMKIKSFRIDAARSQNIEELIAAEAENKFNITKETHEYDYMVAGSVRQAQELKNEIILFTVEKQQVEDHIKMLEKASLVPVAIDTVPCALFRCFLQILRREEDEGAVSVYIDLGSCFTTLIICQGQEIHFAKQIPIGGRDLNKVVASKLDISIEEAVLMRAKLQNEGADSSMDPATRQIIIDAMNTIIQELAKEISLCFKYFTVTFRGKRPARVHFTGGEAYENMLQAALRRQLAVDIKVARPLVNIDVDGTYFAADRRRDYCEWAVVIGLGIRGLNVANLKYAKANDEGN